MTVTGGATVAVRGIVSGPVTIGSESKLCVDGLFTGTVERNDGLLVIAGQANLDLSERLGRLGLAVGSTVVCSHDDEEKREVWTLTEQGELDRLEGFTLHAEVDAGRLHYFDTPVL